MWCLLTWWRAFALLCSEQPWNASNWSDRVAAKHSRPRQQQLHSSEQPAMRSLTPLSVCLCVCVRVCVLQRERHVNTAAGGMYSGTESATPLCTLALTESAEQLVAAAVAPYVQLLKVYRGKATFQAQHQLHSAAPAQPSTASAPSAAAAASSPAPTSTPTPPVRPPSPRVLIDVALPAALLDYRMLLLVPQLDGQSYPELLSLLTHLQGCGCELSALLVCCITVARPALWSVMSVYPTLALMAAAVDEVRHGQLVPGVRSLEARSVKAAHSSQQHSDSQPTSSTSQLSQAEQRGEDDDDLLLRPDSN